MQISKYFFAICAVVLLPGTPSMPAAESEAQAKAREALRQKMSELDAQGQAGRATGKPQAPTATITPTAVNLPPSAVDDEATARAREALRQKMRELAGEPKAEPYAQPGFTPVPTDDAATARAREALRQKMAGLDAQRSAKTAPANRVFSEPTPEYKPIPAAPLPLSGSKEARLAALLVQYKADQITPEQYHQERAKILAEP